MSLKKLFCAATLSLVAATSAQAQDDAGLYAPAPDPNASYVRVVTDTEIGPYQMYMDASAAVSVGEVNMTVNLEPGDYKTVALTASGEAMIADDILTFSPSKADLAFYNLSDQSGVDLFVPAAQANALAGIAAGTYAAQTLNAPLTLDFEVRAGGAVLGVAAGVQLRRGEGVVIVLTGSGGNYSVIASGNTYNLN